MENYKTILRPVIDIRGTGEQIRKLRKQKGYTVRDLQGVFGFEYPQAIYAWEQGKNVPTIDNMLVLSQLFGVELNQIIVTSDIEVVVGCRKSA